MVTLHTERLTWRMLRQTDIDDYARMCADPEIMRYLGDGKPMSRLEAWRHLAMMVGHWQLRGFGMWAVVENATGRFVGRVGCYYPETWPSPEVGWTLRRDYWGQGYATEAARASLRHAFTTLGWSHAISLIRVANLNSIRVAERLGEKLEGQTEVMGYEVLVYGIDRAAFLADRPSTPTI
ncbi:MAG: GNAT family N-acetyltransferase [Gemmataceae bacterium]